MTSSSDGDGKRKRDSKEKLSIPCSSNWSRDDYEEDLKQIKIPKVSIPHVNTVKNPYQIGNYDTSQRLPYSGPQPVVSYAEDFASVSHDVQPPLVIGIKVGYKCIKWKSVGLLWVSFDRI
jgi:hypothetical protein